MDLYHAEYSDRITTGEAWISFEGDGSGREAVLRVLGRLLIAYMPDEGLEEALEDLSRICRFHFENLDLTPDDQGEGPTVRGLLGEPEERPQLVVE